MEPRGAGSKGQGWPASQQGGRVETTWHCRTSVKRIGSALEAARALLPPAHHEDNVNEGLVWIVARTFPKKKNITCMKLNKVYL